MCFATPERVWGETSGALSSTRRTRVHRGVRACCTRSWPIRSECSPSCTEAIAFIYDACVPAPGAAPRPPHTHREHRRGACALLPANPRRVLQEHPGTATRSQARASRANARAHQRCRDNSLNFAFIVASYRPTPPLSRGSRTSLIASPNMFRLYTTMVRQRPGQESQPWRRFHVLSSFTAEHPAPARNLDGHTVTEETKGRLRYDYRPDVDAEDDDHGSGNIGHHVAHQYLQFRAANSFGGLKIGVLFHTDNRPLWRFSSLVYLRICPARL